MADLEEQKVRFKIEPWNTFLNYEEDDEELGTKVMLTMAVSLLIQLTGWSAEEVWLQLVRMALETAEETNGGLVE